MTLVDGFVPPLPCKQCWWLEKLLRQKKTHCITTNIALSGEGEAQLYSHMGGLIIFVKDCRLKSLKYSVYGWQLFHLKEF